MQNWFWRNRWPVGIIGTLVVAVIVILAVLRLAVWHDDNQNGPRPSPTVTQSPAITAEEREAAAEKAEVARYLTDKAPAFNCVDDLNKTAERRKDLVLCPAYIASIKLNGDKASQKPTIVNPTDENGVPMITITAEHYGGWENNSDILGKTVWREYWTFKVTYHPSVYPAGKNQEYTEQFSAVLSGYNSRWVGPQAIGWQETTFMLRAGAIVTYELYGAAANMSVPGQPLPADKLGLRLY